MSCTALFAYRANRNCSSSSSELQQLAVMTVELTWLALWCANCLTRCNSSDKKFELMLTRRAKAYSSFCSQTVSLSPAISLRILRGYSFLMPSCAGFLEPRKSRLKLSKSMLNGENFISSLSMSISIGFGAIRSWNVSHSPKSLKKSIKTPILTFKFIQGHWIRWQSRASVQLLISD